MNASELKYRIECANPDSKFFSRENMKFAGDTMCNFGVSSATVRTPWDSEGNYSESGGVSVECWELYRKKPVKHGLVGTVAYWDKTTFKRVYSAKA